MAIRQIVTGKDNPRLRKKSREVVEINDRIKELVSDMKQTLKREDGVGLAAPQVGVLRRVIIIDYDDKTFEILNPVVSNKKGSCIDNEGCLSLLPASGYVERPESLTVVGKNIEGEDIKIEAEGMLARIVCHEVDHLEGVLFVDKVIPEDQLEPVEEAE